MHPSSALGTLAAAVAHEVNNPLAVVVVNLHTIRRMLGTLDLSPADRATVDDVFEIIEESEESARRVSGVVDQLRMFSAPTAAVPDRVSLTEVVDLCYRLLRPELLARVEPELTLEPTPTVSAHAADLGRMLMHLLAEATADADPSQRHSNRLHIRADTVDGAARVRTISSPADAERAPDAGLEVAVTIAESLGGTLSARVADGARTVEVRLPAAASITPLTAEPTRSRVFILDDERLVTRSVRRLLMTDHEVVTANDPLTALEMLANDDAFDVLIVDLRMPHLSGVEFHAALVEKHPACAERLLFMSGGADEELVGPAGLPRPCLVKPVRPERLREAVQAMAVSR